jgi:Sigma-70 region 2
VPGDALGEATLARARAGDEEAFRELTDPHRRELHLHCYRILGSVQDAEDLVQETLLAAWRGLEAFEGRASVRAWLYRIATNRCLNALRARSRPAAGPGERLLAASFWLAAKASSRAGKCETCGNPLECQGAGRPRKFCGPECFRAARNRPRQVVPSYMYDAELKTYVPNPSPRSKSKVRRRAAGHGGGGIWLLRHRSLLVGRRALRDGSAHARPERRRSRARHPR